MRADVKTPARVLCGSPSITRTTDPRPTLSSRGPEAALLHAQGADCAVDRLRASRLAVTVERGPASELDGVGDQLRTLRPCRTTARVANGVARKIDRASNVLSAAALQCSAATIVAVAIAGASGARLKDCNAGSGPARWGRHVYSGLCADIDDARAVVAVGKNNCDAPGRIVGTQRRRH